jgi:hypothetical protein
MRVLLVLLALTATVQAQAPSLLGICHPGFNCDRIKSLYDGQDKVILSWLENTFGTECKCLEPLLNDARPKIIRAHLIQSPCMRNKRCGRYEALWGYTAASASRAALKPESRLRRRFAVILEQFKRRIEGKELTCYVSPCLECDLYEPARRELANLVSATLPNCNIVDNPYRRRCLRGYTCEKHGTNPIISAPCIVDLDGVDGQLVDLNKWVADYKHCDLQFYWELWMNCIRGEFIDPRQRNCRYRQSLFDSTRYRICQSFSPLSDICSL